MFRPLKNFITYLQRNASSSSLFGGNTSFLASQQTSEREMNSIKVSSSAQMDDVNIRSTDTVPIKAISPTYSGREEEEEMGNSKVTDITCPDLLTSTNANQDFDEDDIETQIKSSIMLKKPLKDNVSDIAPNITINTVDVLNITKSPVAPSIVISREHNRNHPSTAISLDDELDDFRHDPTEDIGHQMTMSDFTDLAEGEHTDTTARIENLIDLTRNNSTMAFSNSSEVPEEPYLDIEQFPNNEIIVVGEDELNSSMISETSINDDPLAIANDEEDAFTVDRSAALKELNLLNTSTASIADNDFNTVTTEDDLECWLENEAKHQYISVDAEKGKDVLLLTTTVSSTDKVSPTDEREEGSDSGLGSETTALPINVSNLSDTCQPTSPSTGPSQTPIATEKSKSIAKIENEPKNVLSKSVVDRESIKLKRSNLKRRLEAVDDDDDDDVGLHDLTGGSRRLTDSHSSVQKKPKRSINFNTVQVFYFPRQQGFSCVPSAGGCTLGMAAHHVAFKTMTLAEHAAELRRAHRMQLQEINPRGSSSDDSEESEEDYLSEGSGSDLDAESSGFLQPVSPKQRRALLKAAGIRKIDASEKVDCRDIRNSREVCGCTCRDFCDPETCSCSQSGIKCQVDRDMFPCGCSRDACGNTVGRVEFNPARVRTHFIHTLMRLEMENRQQQNPYHVNLSTTTTLSSTTNASPVNFYQSHMQSQSNYSSGYASPAYNAMDQNQQTVPANDYYQQQQQRNNTAHLYGPHTAAIDGITHSVGNALPTSTAPLSQYAVDSLIDSNLFAGATSVTTGYGDLIPVSTYHNTNYGNVATQVSTYNSYSNTAPYISMNGTNLLHTQPTTFNSCSMPSDRPYGTATTTESIESSVVEFTNTSQMTTLETTTAPSYAPLSNESFVCAMETEATTNFISLRTPLASSTHLTEINDLLQCNRNTSSALVAVTQKQTMEEVVIRQKEQLDNEINANGHECETYSKDVFDDNSSLHSKGIYEELSTLTTVGKAEGINDKLNCEEKSKPPSIPSTTLSLPEETQEYLDENHALCGDLSVQSCNYVDNNKSLPEQFVKCETEIADAIINVVSN
uniref:Cysteine/serine-rich nuclear protein N-terminal domain-containing protein n=1 Tax=Glossina morsitans morsitans TaxID=37546 RepID=A0A1B0F9J7_GLOMM